MKNYDVIIIGAGSIGLSCAWCLSEKQLKVLVIESSHTYGQGQAKAAIGGVRATHSEGAKIAICNESIKIFSTWQDKYGDNIDWVQGGYLYPAYTEKVEQQLKNLLELQQKNNLNISWITPDRISELVLGINKENLLGGTFSPEDGHISSLLGANALYKQSKSKNTEYHFNEYAIKCEKGKVITDKDSYYSDCIIISTGVERTSELIGLDLPVEKELHEAAITEPYAKFTGSMVVDIEILKNSKSFYCYQNKEGQIVFCLTPEPQIISEEKNCTKDFLINASRRLLKLLPFAGDIKVRRTWSGFYPMTPDGIPFLDFIKEKNIYIAVGMCGQGLMLGPGIAMNIAEMILKGKAILNDEQMKQFSIGRDFSKTELLK